jgi:hypothetical protein
MTLPFVWSLDRSSDVGRALLAATRRLKETGSDSPQLDSAILMAHVLGVSKGWLYAHPNRQLTLEEIAGFEELVRRRMCQEPVAYLVGFKPFYGLDITVDQRLGLRTRDQHSSIDRYVEPIEGLEADQVGDRLLRHPAAHQLLKARDLLRRQLPGGMGIKPALAHS